MRLFLRGEGLRSIERLAGVDRKTVRRYLAAAGELGLVRDGGRGAAERRVRRVAGRGGAPVPA
jgi:hypothetical protein